MILYFPRVSISDYNKQLTQEYLGNVLNDEPGRV